jgi:ribosomal protein S12 methylthiotransferase
VSKKPKKAALITLGCPKNQVDSEVMGRLLQENGVRLTGDPAGADVVLINTCGFIRDAKQESIDSVLNCIELKKNDPSKKIMVWGCLAERYGGQIQKLLPETDAAFGVEPFDAVGRFLFNASYKRSDRPFRPRCLSGRVHTAYLKIADGCDHQCTFCAIPQFKGRTRSRSMDSLAAEAEWLAQTGVQECILVAQDTTAYGRDRNDGSSLAKLLKRLAAVKGIRWFRVMYMHPAHITDELIELMSGEPSICKYADVPFQHIADPVLNAMGRGTPRASIEKLIQKLRSRISGLTLRTAFIVGFPGETEKAFGELERFVGELRFERLGVFAYSSEEGTPSASYRGRVAAQTARKRARLLMERQEQISAERNKTFETGVFRVLVDGYDAGQRLSYGRTEGDAPEIDQTVWIRAKVPAGKFVDVAVDGSSAYDLTGKPVRFWRDSLNNPSVHKGPAVRKGPAVHRGPSVHKGPAVSST